MDCPALSSFRSLRFNPGLAFRISGLGLICNTILQLRARTTKIWTAVAACRGEAQRRLECPSSPFSVAGLLRRTGVAALRRVDSGDTAFRLRTKLPKRRGSRAAGSALPVPGIFLAKDAATNKFLVIDGQQRLKTLKFFIEGTFNPHAGEDKSKVFRLVEVQKPFDGVTYSTLEEKDRLRLENSIIHATIVKQDAPADGDTSIYHIFERLNTGGLKLTPQEVRTAASYGTLIVLLRSLNSDGNWRKIFGKPSVVSSKCLPLFLRV